MAQVGSRSTSQRARQLWVVVGATLSLAREARGECRITPAADGSIATWLAQGPFGRTVPPRGATVESQLAAWIDASRSAALAPLEANASWHPVADDDDRVHLDTTSLRRGARQAWLALGLRVERPLELQLFAGADDGFAVFLDGREIDRRGGVHDAVDDDERITLSLTPGTHNLAIAQHVNGGALRFHARFLGADFNPANGVSFLLPGVDDATCDRLAVESAHITRPVRVTDHGLELVARVTYPGGTAHRDAETSRVVALRETADGAMLASSTIPLDVAHLPTDTTLQIARDDQHPNAVLTIASNEPRSLEARIAAPVLRALRHASTTLARFDEHALPAWLPRGSFTSVAYVHERLTRLVRDRDDDASHLLDEANTLEDLAQALDASRDPYLARRGALRRGYRSEVDGSLQGYSIYVPPAYHREAFPLVVALHGLGGSAHRMLPVLFGLYDEHEAREHADRHLPALPDARAIIVAPFGFGDAGYRALGETDVMAVIDEVRAAYRIDATRTYMTGLSMGGIGAASIPLHHPDVFAAAAPLCGYHSYFVRHDTDGTRQPWEPFLMESRSNASWAENGLHLPLYIVHGTLDRPVANSRVLVDRYTELHYDVESEWPELGHNVWSTTYADGRIIPRFLRYRRDEAPRHVRFRTPSTRWNHSDWVAIDALAVRDRWGEIDATVSADAMRVTTNGVHALTLSPPTTLFTAGTSDLTVRIDGDALSTRRGEALSCERGADGHWHAVSTRSTSPAIGPIRDVFDGPTVVVYGTGAASDTAMNLRVAEAWARVRGGVHAHIPVLADSELDDDTARTHTLVLVGTRASNAYLARIGDRLPMRVERDAITLGTRNFRGAQVGAVFVARNPEQPSQTVLVVTGTSALGVWRSRFLPDLVPDYVIFDEHIANARGRIILGTRASVLGAGYWSAAQLEVPSTSSASAPPR